MKKICIIISLFILMLSAYAQSFSIQDVPNNLQLSYEGDVKSLALEEVYNQFSIYRDSIFIPQSFQEPIWEALTEVYNFFESPYRDSVFDIYCIHNTYSLYKRYSIKIKIDPMYAWTSYWTIYDIHTGVPEVDSLVIPYGFYVEAYNGSSEIVELKTDQLINLQAFCDSISSFGGVVYAEISNQIGDGNKIQYTNLGSTKKFDFVVGMGDCPSGCTEHHILHFSVSELNGPSFQGVSSSATYPIPEYNCNITTGLSKYEKKSIECSVYPNPFSSATTIKFSSIQSNTHVSVFNINGVEILKFQDFSGKELRISRDGLTSGVYFIFITDDKGFAFKQKLVVID